VRQGLGFNELLHSSSLTSGANLDFVLMHLLLNFLFNLFSLGSNVCFRKLLACQDPVSKQTPNPSIFFFRISSPLLLQLRNWKE
jgi:hypothetical protein